MNFQEMLKNLNEKTIKIYWINFYERIINIIFPILSKKKNKRLDKVIFILDFKNAKLFPLLSGKIKKFFMSFLKINQTYYPGLTHKCFVINSGVTFKAIWAIAKLIVNKEIKDSTSIINGHGLEEINQYIDIENIPAILGGKGEEGIFENPCHFNKELEHSKKNNFWYLPNFEDYSLFLEKEELIKFSKK